jgi:hypothetical protein
MGDPLIARYQQSFSSPNKYPQRKAHEPLPAEKLKKASEQIQSTGKPFEPPMPATAAVRLVVPPQPKDWLTAPVSMQQQFDILQSQELVRLQALANAPVKYPSPQQPGLAGQAPVGMVQQLDELKRQETDRWRKLLDEWARIEMIEYDILWQIYTVMVLDEYLQLAKPGAQWSAAFMEFEQRKGSDLYSDLRPVYYRANIKEPHKFIMTLISSGVSLVGVPVLQGIHPKFAAILSRVDKSINKSMFADFGIQPVKYIGCFRPSTLIDPKTKQETISNHMIGAAIDIDATISGEDRNPHLNPKQTAALDLVLDFRVKHQQLAAGSVSKASGSWLAGIPKDDSVDRARRLYSQTLQISKETRAFLDEFLDGWVAFSKQPPKSFGDKRDQAFPIVKQMADVFGGEKALRNIQKGGILSIPAEVFEALASDPDLWSGASYKDLMHFEIRRQSDIIGP